MTYFGTRDNIVNKIPTLFAIMYVDKCTEATRQPGDPKCASDEEISKWLETKKLVWYFISSKIELNSWDNPIRFQEQQMFGMTIALDTFSDTGLRYRRNVLKSSNNWYWNSLNQTEVYDVMIYNADTFYRKDYDYNANGRW